MKDRKPYALLLNDMHVSKDNISEFRLNWDEALEICKGRGIPEIIIGGDLWMSRSAQTLPTLMAVRNVLLKATLQSINVTIACGNHDKVDQEGLDSYNHLFHEYEGVDVIDDYAIYDISDEATLYIMSYFPENGSFVERFKEMAAGLSHKVLNVLYIHEGIRGGLAQPSDDELPADLFADFDSVLVGHYHDRKRIKGTSIQYIGASRQHNFGEDEEKGYTILYDNGSTEFIKNQVNDRYITLDLTPSQLEDIDDIVDNIYDQSDCTANYKVRVRVVCNNNEKDTIDRNALLEAGITKVEVVSGDTPAAKTAQQSLTVKFDKAGIKEEYKAFCAEKSIGDVNIGLKYLDKIS